MSTIKKTFQPIYKALVEANQEDAIKVILPLIEAKKGGFSGTDSFVTITNEDGTTSKIARVCAMTGAVWAHDNNNKDVSFYYKNGSYMIGAEVVKANARKQWEAQKEQALADLETQMLDGDITPAEWKAQRDELEKSQFDFKLDEDTKQYLIETFEGVQVLDQDGQPDHEASKALWLEKHEAGELKPFSAFAEEIEALRKA